MPFICQIGIQAPEYLNDTQGSLGHRLGNISACRGYGSDNGQSSLSVVLTQGNYTAGALIKLCQTRAQVCRVALLTGHFLQTP